MLCDSQLWVPFLKCLSAVSSPWLSGGSVYFSMMYISSHSFGLSLPQLLSWNKWVSVYWCWLAIEFLWWVGAREDGAAGSQRGLFVLLTNCPEHRVNNGHVSQNEYLGSIQNRQGQVKGHSCSVGGLAWRSTTNSCMYLQCVILMPLIASTFIKCSFFKK